MPEYQALVLRRHKRAASPDTGSLGIAIGLGVFFSTLALVVLASVLYWTVRHRERGRRGRRPAAHARTPPFTPPGSPPGPARNALAPELLQAGVPLEPLDPTAARGRSPDRRRVGAAYPSPNDDAAAAQEGPGAPRRSISPLPLYTPPPSYGHDDDDDGLASSSSGRRRRRAPTMAFSRTEAELIETVMARLEGAPRNAAHEEPVAAAAAAAVEEEEGQPRRLLPRQPPPAPDAQRRPLAPEAEDEGRPRTPPPPLRTVHLSSSTSPCAEVPRPVSPRPAPPPPPPAQATVPPSGTAGTRGSWATTSSTMSDDAPERSPARRSYLAGGRQTFADE